PRRRHRRRDRHIDVPAAVQRLQLDQVAPGWVSCRRMIVTESVESYLAASRPEPDPLLAEMEAHGARESIPIVVPETGILLQILALTHGARRIVEVGTAIGVSTLYLARALPPGGTIVSFEIDPH